MYDTKIGNVDYKILIDRAAVDTFVMASHDEEEIGDNEFCALAVSRSSLWNQLRNSHYNSLSEFDDRYYALSEDQKEDMSIEFADKHIKKYMDYFMDSILNTLPKDFGPLREYLYALSAKQYT